MEMTLGLSLLAFISVFLLFLGVDSVLRGQKQVIESRLDRYASRAKTGDTTAVPVDNQARVVHKLNRLIVSQNASQRIATEIARADLKLTPQEYVLVNIASVLVCFLLVLWIMKSNLLLALIGGLVGFYIPRIYVRWLQAKRLNAFNNQLSDTLSLLSNSLRSGYSMLQSMETVSSELPPPMSVEFARVVREVGLGLTVEDALFHLLTRINSEDLDLVITAINIQHEVGGNLADILDTIAHTIRERVRIKGQIRSLTASQRLSGNVVALLPIAVGLFLTLFNPNYISGMWSDPCGLMMLGVGGVTVATGYLAIQKITQIEV